MRMCLTSSPPDSPRLLSAQPTDSYLAYLFLLPLPLGISDGSFCFRASVSRQAGGIGVQDFGTVARPQPLHGAPPNGLHMGLDRGSGTREAKGGVCGRISRRMLIQRAAAALNRVRSPY